jgi:thymidylate synthase
MTMESEYLNLIQDVLMNGVKKMDRTGTGTLSVFGRQIRCDLNKGFPAITTKKLFWKGVVGELLWLLSGSTNVKPLQDQDIHIWDAWADKETGELGPVYGKQWRNWTQYAYVQGETPLTFERIKSNRIDQIANVIETIKTNPDSRRMVVSAWNVGQLSQMALEPCHAFFQFYTREIPVNERVMLLGHKYGGEIRAKTNDPKFMEAILAQEKIPTRYLDCQMYQRSADRPGHRAPGRRARHHLRGRPHLPEPPGSGERDALPGPPGAPGPPAQPRHPGHRWLPACGRRTGRVPSLPRHRRSDCNLGTR